VREPEHLMLARPRDRRVEQAGDADPVRQSTFDGGLDEARCQEGQRDRHVDVALAAGLPCGDAVDCCGAGPDLGQPLPSARDYGDDASFSGRLRRPKKRGPDHRVPVMANAICVRLR
jgi:hypothetical protein